MAARGLSAIETAIETVKRDVFSREVNEGPRSVVAKSSQFNPKINRKSTIF